MQNIASTPKEKEEKAQEHSQADLNQHVDVVLVALSQYCERVGMNDILEVEKYQYCKRKGQD